MDLHSIPNPIHPLKFNTVSSQEKKKKNGENQEIIDVILKTNTSSSSKTIKGTDKIYGKPIPPELLPWIEDGNESDLTTEEIELFSDVFDQYIVRLTEDNPFASTDLLIFKGDYPGLIPLNGIKESEFESVQKLYDMINKRALDSVIQIEEGNSQFHEWVMKQILLLLTRPCGREILNKIQQERPFYDLIEIEFFELVEISENDDDSSYDSDDIGIVAKEKKSERKMVIDFNIAQTEERILEHLPTGRIGERKTMPHIILGHELIHCLYEKLIPGPLIHNDYYDRNEQIAITGYPDVLILPDLQARNEMLKNLSEDSPEYKKIMEDYNKNISKAWADYKRLNEWTLTSQFTDKEHVMYPRFGHLSAPLIPEGIALDSPQMILFVEKILESPVSSSYIDKLQNMGFNWKLISQNDMEFIMCGLIKNGYLHSLISLYEIYQKTFNESISNDSIRKLIKIADALCSFQKDYGKYEDISKAALQYKEIHKYLLEKEEGK